MSDVGYVQNKASGEVHRVEYRVVRGRRKRLSQEECQLDDIKRMARLTQEEAEAAEKKCGHCYSEPGE